MRKKNPDGDYEIGYGRPPKKNQFQKGVSGNPNGKPKKPRDLESELLREANSLITIIENGRKTRVSKHKIIIKMMLNNAMKGKSSDLRMYLALYPQAIEKDAQLKAQKKSKSQRTVKNLTDEELMEIARTGLKEDDPEEE